MEFRCCFFLLSSSFAFVRVGFHCVSGGWHLLCYLFELNAPTEHSIEKDVKIDKYAQRIGWEYIISARFFSFHSRSLLSFPFRGFFFMNILLLIRAQNISIFLHCRYFVSLSGPEIFSKMYVTSLLLAARYSLHRCIQTHSVCILYMAL